MKTGQVLKNGFILALLIALPIYVADFSKMSKMPDENRDFYAAVDTGFISQNVYLYCASVGLATVVRGSIDKPALAKAMKLRPEQKIILVQTIGYPK